jgi:hypothetical protein
LNARSCAHLVAPLAALALTGCVPDAEETAPRGALGAVFSPSAATRGEPFVTEDGFTLTIERSVAYVAIGPQQQFYNGNGNGTDYESLGQGDSVFSDFRLPLTLVLRAAGPGPRTATCSLSSFSSFGSDYDDGESYQRRFLRDLKRNGTEDLDLPKLVKSVKYGYTGFIRVRAVRGTEVWTMDQPISTFNSIQRNVQGTVEKNKLHTVAVTVHAENVFFKVTAAAVTEGNARFAPFVAADLNRDHVISPEELELATPPTAELPRLGSGTREDPAVIGPGGIGLIEPKTMGQLFAFRLNALFQTP